MVAWKCTLINVHLLLELRLAEARFLIPQKMSLLSQIYTYFYQVPWILHDEQGILPKKLFISQNNIKKRTKELDTRTEL